MAQSHLFGSNRSLYGRKRSIVSNYNFENYKMLIIDLPDYFRQQTTHHKRKERWPNQKSMTV